MLIYRIRIPEAQNKYQKKKHRPPKPQTLLVKPKVWYKQLSKAKETQEITSHC